MRMLLLPFFLIACEQVAPTGNPLEPVPVTVPEDPQPSADAVSPPDEEGGEEEVFTISSEELAAVVRGDESSGDDSVEDDTPAQGAEKQPSTDSPSPSSPSTAASNASPQPNPQPSPRPGWPGQTANAWPVRLVTTVPNASPPRAILGLPDGREVVVNPGSMVPDLGIVVVAISPNSAELAKVAPAGDHATIESMTLTAQY